MSNPIEIPENIIAVAKKMIEDSACYGDNSLELANFIATATRPEFEPVPFVVYRVVVKGYAGTCMGFRVEKDVLCPWVVLSSHSPTKGEAYSLSQCNTIHQDEDITVIERWTPEPVFGIGDSGDDVPSDQEVLIKGIVESTYVDDDGDVRVALTYSDGLTDSHYVSADNVALLNNN